MSLSVNIGKHLNFGCIQLMHPILDSLNGTQHEWLKKLLFTFNEGNIGKFEALAPLFPKEVPFLPLLSDTSTADSCKCRLSYKRTFPSFVRRSASWLL